MSSDLVVYDEAAFISARAPVEPATHLYTHRQWADLHADMAEQRRKRVGWADDALARIQWAGHVYKTSRVELGLLRLYLLRERAWGLAMVEGLKSATLTA